MREFPTDCMKFSLQGREGVGEGGSGWEGSPMEHDMHFAYPKVEWSKTYV